MKALIELLEKGEELSEAIKIGLAVKHITSSKGKYTRIDDHGQYVFYGEWDLIEYYNEHCTEN